MRRIVKEIEPTSLTQHRSTPNSNYENYTRKDDLRMSLVAEQRGLCCYCLSRIHADRDSMKIEHWRSKSRYPADELTYSNLLAACKGNDGKAREIQHCDTRKGDADLKWNPSDQLHPVEQMIFFQDGKLRSRDAEFDTQIDDILNLNLPFLQENRREILDAFTRALRKNRQPLDRKRLERLLDQWPIDPHTGALKPYCQVVVYWISKRLLRP